MATLRGAIQQTLKYEGKKKGGSKFHRVYGCQRFKIDPAQNVGLVSGEKGGVWFNNLRKCGSVWICPTCQYKINNERKNEIGKALGDWLKQGRKLSFVTLTFPHYRHENLHGTLKTLTEGFREIFSGRTGAEAKELIGMDEYVRVLEITTGTNGYHPHYHLVIVHPEKFTPEQLEFSPLYFRELWREAMHKRDRRINEFGFHCEPVRNIGDVAGYLAKWGVVHELTAAASKESKTKHPFEKWALDIDKKDLVLTEIRDFYRATKGKHQIDRSNGFYLTKIKEDADILTDDKIERTHVIFCPETWIHISANELQSDLINSFLKGGVVPVLYYLRQKIPCRLSCTSDGDLYIEAQISRQRRKRGKIGQQQRREMMHMDEVRAIRRAKQDFVYLFKDKTDR